MAFEQLFQAIVTTISQLSKLQPDLDPLLTQLQTVREIFKKYKPPSADDDSPKESGITDANLLWHAIEPILYLHDSISKYLQDGQEDAEESKQDYSSDHGQLGDYTNQLVYRYLAVMIESSVRELRNALKAARDRVDEEAAKADSAKVYQPGSASDPSHSDLSKDHFSNALNQPAGLVATVTTNWTVQQVVRCWDNHKLDAHHCVDEILSILHHPAFASAGAAVNKKSKTPIQQYMFDTVEAWWQANSAQDKDALRGKLTKESVQQRQHEDHTLTLKDFEGRHRGPASFPGAWPLVRQPPKKASILAGWINDAIADFNWALGIVQRARRGDPLGAWRQLGRAGGLWLHNMVLVVVALWYSIFQGVMWVFARVLWPFGRSSG